jgi:hypothetical protein
MQAKDKNATPLTRNSLQIWFLKTQLELRLTPGFCTLPPLENMAGGYPLYKQNFPFYQKKNWKIENFVTNMLPTKKGVRNSIHLTH